MKEQSYTTGLLLGAVLLLVVGIVFTWLEVAKYGESQTRAIPAARPAASTPDDGGAAVEDTDAEEDAIDGEEGDAPTDAEGDAGEDEATAGGPGGPGGADGEEDAD